MPVGAPWRVRTKTILHFGPATAPNTSQPESGNYFTARDDGTPHLDQFVDSTTLAETNNQVQTVMGSNASTDEYLLSHFGPLLTLKHLAEVLHTTPTGLRMTLARRRQPMAIGLAGARRRLGRRLYFDARRTAELIDGESMPTPDKHEPGPTGWRAEN